MTRQELFGTALLEIKKILEALPGLSIHSITDITDTVDETIDETNSEKQKEV